MLRPKPTRLELLPQDVEEYAELERQKAMNRADGVGQEEESVGRIASAPKSSKEATRQAVADRIGLTEQNIQKLLGN